MDISIGNINLTGNVVLAPMSGVTDLPYRRLAKKHGAALVVSEMIASRAMIYANKKTMKMASNCAEEFPMAVQLAGCEPRLMAEAARLNSDRGAAIIDINMGCPVKKVTKGHAGSALMRDLKLAAELISAVVGNVDINRVEDARALLDQSGADGVMIGRGTYGRPWFLNQVRHYLETGILMPDPTVGEKIQIIKRHYNELLEYYGIARGLRIGRKHLGWYSKGFPCSAMFREKVNTSDNYKEVQKIINEFLVFVESEHVK